MVRYALLRHECPNDYRNGPHWDLMLERPGSDLEHRLATWSLSRLPMTWALAVGLPVGVAESATQLVPAEALPDHRARYLDYEGVVSGGRGTVTQVAGGAIHWLELTPSRVRVSLFSPEHLAGDVELTRLQGNEWQLQPLPSF